jgi:hypothetical protein
MLTDVTFAALWQQIRVTVHYSADNGAQYPAIKTAIRTLLNERNDLGNLSEHVLRMTPNRIMLAFIYDISDMHRDMWLYLGAMSQTMIEDPLVAPLVVELALECIAQDVEIADLPDLHHNRTTISRVLLGSAAHHWFVTNFPGRVTVGSIPS